MTVCRTAVEPFFSVSWGSGLSDQMQGRGFDIFLGYSSPRSALSTSTVFTDQYLPLRGGPVSIKSIG